MATEPLLPFLLLLLLLRTSSPAHGLQASPLVYPMQCSKPCPAPACSSLLYVVPGGVSPSDIASRYSANASLVQPFLRRLWGPPDLLVEVPCACESAADNLTALFHDTVYNVKVGDTAFNVTNAVFGGLAWGVPEDLIASDNITVRLACGCSSNTGGGANNAVPVVVSYAVQSNDTLADIADLFDTDAESTEKMNPQLKEDPNLLSLGQLLFVPQEAHSPPLTPPAAAQSL